MRRIDGLGLKVYAAAAILAAITAACLAFGWPVRVLSAYWQVTYGNVLAEPLSVALIGALAYPFRHQIGRHLAGWWAKHHHQHAIEAHLEALRIHSDQQAEVRKARALKHLHRAGPLSKEGA